MSNLLYASFVAAHAERRAAQLPALSRCRFKNAPHPNTAWLFHRWAASDEGQKAFGIEGRVPANPRVEPAERVDLTTVYGLGEKEYREFAKYEKIWKQIFNLR